MAPASIFLAKPFTLTKHSSTAPLLSFHAYNSTYKFTYGSGLPLSGKRRLQRISKVVMTIGETSAAITQDVLKEKPAILDLTALVTVKFKKEGPLKELIRRAVESAGGSQGGGVVLQLVSQEVDPKTMKSKLSKEVALNWSESHSVEAGGVHRTYKVNLQVDSDFGIPGAIYVRSQYQEEFFLASASIEEVARFTCGSWVQPAKDSSVLRIFFCDKAYLPSQTPSGLKELRQRELQDLKGDGQGLRLPSDRIYDYDVYNDLGNPDKGSEYARPTLGGKNKPYPRRCRTGRSPTATDKHAESPPSSTSLESYVPRDEEYAEVKNEFMSQGKMKAVLRNIVPIVIATIFGDENFYLAVNVDSDQTGSKTKVEIVSQKELVNANPFFKILTKLHETLEKLFKLDPPKYISKNVMWGLLDDEFGRRVLAGSNAVNIEKLKVFPPVGKLDPSIYGSQESALKEEHLTGFLEGMSVQQAIDAEKLFVLDYHDLYLPYVDRINAIEGRKTYATRTIFFLSPFGTLKPIAIELSLPSTDEKASSKQVLTPTDGTAKWLWELAKEYVLANDTAVHALVNHWLRIHACMEPFIIAANRNLSVMHPIFKLLHPHMRYMMKTNAFTREVLVCAGEFVESYNDPFKYCMEFSCSAYQDWRFDLEGHPADLIRRGMAVPDTTLPHGLKLTIEDYPYAQDGLLIWSATEKLVTKYVNYFYPQENIVQNDTELQAWYSEFVKVGHADMKDATWWPKLSTQRDLINILTTIIWKVTGQHAVHNFGQYGYGGYVPARPPFMRRLLPSENDPDYELLLANPQEYFLGSFPSLTQAVRYASVLDTGSAHSPDKEYIGERKDLTSWAGEVEILDAFREFSADVKLIEQEIVRRNSDPTLRNRCGGGAFPFELLIPSSESGTTNRGVPNSVTT